MRIDIDELKGLCEGILLSYGLTKEQAEIVFDEYLYGELTDKKNHGFIGFPDLTKKLPKKQGWKIEKEDDSYALIDGQGSLGILIGKYAMDLAIKKAYHKGISIVGMHNMWSYLMPGYYAKMAANQNMIGIVFDNSMSSVAPHSGINPKLGPNPIGLAIPSKEPFIIDMATSTRTKEEVRLADKLGTLLQKGTAIDKEGNETRDPKEVHALTPGYKGYALGLAIEIIAGSLVRAKMGKERKTALDRGFLFIVINPEIFVDIKTFQEEVSHYIADLKTSRQSGDSPIRIPGEVSQENYQAMIKKGYVELDEEIGEAIMLMVKRNI